MIGILIICSMVAYLIFLGRLASKKNRSVIIWVGLTIIFSPLSYIVSYPLLLTAKVLPKKEGIK